MTNSPSLLKEPGYISNPSCISIGRNVTVQGGYYWNILESASGSTPELTIRDGSRIEAGLHVQCSHKVHIGRNVKIGPNVSLTDSTADADQPGYPAWAQPANNSNTCGELIVGDGSIIGAHVVINRAVKIGKFSIIEPNSVVVDHIPSFCRVSGNPAVVTQVFVPELLEWVKVNSDTERESALARRIEHPLLSIVIPTYNRVQHLSNNLQSIYKQVSNEDLVEVVVSDNASTDHTLEVGRVYDNLYSSFHYSRNEQNIGGDLNIAYVSTLAKGSFIKLQGDDDYWLNGALIDFIGILLEHLDCALIHTMPFLPDNRVYTLEGGDLFLAHTSNNAMQISMNTMKRSVWDQIEDKSKYAYTSINQIYWFYEILMIDPKFCMINHNFHLNAGIAPEGYNIGEVCIKHFLDALHHYEGRTLKRETIHEEKKKRFYNVILPLYGTIVRNKFPSDVSNLERYYTDYYANEDYYEDGLLKLREISVLQS